MMQDEQELVPGAPPRGRFTIVYLIHEAFRRDLARLIDAVRAPAMEAPRAGQLGAHWAYVNEQLHHHHQVEDASLWPLVRPKLAGREDQLAVLDEMEAQHHTLEPLCLAVEEGFASFSREPDDASGRDLADRMGALTTPLSAHLADEETRCFPVLDAALSVEEFESFGKATAKAVGMRGSARFFPWIFDGADPVERAAVLQMPPAPVRFLCGRIWEPSYTRRSAALWAS
jgi:iron-sulfur cluster repair protein YtfE (RIC family)